MSHAGMSAAQAAQLQAHVQQAMGDALLRSLETAEEALDAEISRMERMDEEDFERLREKRLEQIRQRERQKREWLAKGHGAYREVTDQKSFFEELKQSPRAIVHFFRSTTWRCQIVDRHLQELARKHIETKFIKVDAEKSPFIVDRLRIMMIPTIVLVKDGKTEHSIIGFDEMGGTDDFSTERFEELLVAHGVLLEQYV